MEEKYVLITGAAGGIGKITSEYLAKNGFNIFACDLAVEGLNTFSSERIFPIHLDVTDEQSIQFAKSKIKNTTNQLHGLVNIAGIFDQFPLAEAHSNSFKSLINVNLIGPQLIIKAFFPLLLKAKGRIINLSSETVLAQMPLQSYGFSKKLFDVWNTQLRMELKLVDVEVIAIIAGGHQTPFINRSAEVISKIDEQSNYVKLLHQVKSRGLKILKEKQSDPLDLAKVIYKALTSKKPKTIYHVNVSRLFMMLSFIPSRIREYLINHQLKKWMKN